MTDRQTAMLEQILSEVKGIRGRLDGIDRRLESHDGALRALLEGQSDIRTVIVRDGAAQHRINDAVARHVPGFQLDHLVNELADDPPAREGPE